MTFGVGVAWRAFAPEADPAYSRKVELDQETRDDHVARRSESGF